MASIPIAAYAILTTAASTAYGINQSKQAAKVEHKNRENTLARRQENERNALRENTKRRLEEKKRRLSRIRVQNAASGLTNSGTQLAVFGEVESRLDEGIDEATSKSMGRINDYSHQIELSKFSTQMKVQAANTSQYTNLVKTGVRLGAAKKAAEDNGTYKDPFSIY
tara:strand:- start:1882 stop:2382 length:501 start_codon:yes stop_codon:yes gene_type:complete